MKIKGAAALMESLVKEKAKVIFGIPGGAILDVYNEIVSYEKDIRHVLMRHEQCAAHAAEGYARALDVPGVCFATSGPGATNLVTGIADAYCDSVPVVAVTGQVASPLIGNDAFQEADIVGITLPITKHSFQIRSPDEIAYSVKAAFHISNTGRKGPVLIDFPKDLQQKECEYEYPKEIKFRGYNPNLVGHPKQIKKAAEEILRSEMPVILAGGGVISSNAAGEVVALAEALIIPVATTLMGKGTIPDTHPLSVGMVGMHGRKAANKLIQESDLVIAVGCRFSDRTTGKVGGFAPKAKMIHIDIDTAEVGKNVRADIPIVGDAKSIVKDLMRTIASSKGKVTEQWKDKVRELVKECECDFDFPGVPIKPQKVMHEINRIIGDRTTIVTEVGQCQMWAAHFLRMKHPRQFISSGGLGTMGFGFPASIGAKVALPDNHVIDVAGDGSFLMTAQDLATCVENGIAPTVVVMNNGWLGMVKQWQELFYDKRYSATSLGKSPDFVKLAEAFGAKGIRVEKPGEIAPALEESRRSDVATVINVAIDPDEHILPMVASGKSLSEIMECRKK